LCARSAPQRANSAPAVAAAATAAARATAEQVLSDWDRFARGEYLRLAVEEEPDDMQVRRAADCLWLGVWRGAARRGVCVCVCVCARARAWPAGSADFTPASAVPLAWPLPLTAPRGCRHMRSRSLQVDAADEVWGGGGGRGGGAGGGKMLLDDADLGDELAAGLAGSSSAAGAGAGAAGTGPASPAAAAGAGAGAGAGNGSSEGPAAAAAAAAAEDFLSPPAAAAGEEGDAAAAMDASS
jgi:hypothetical protein